MRTSTKGGVLRRFVVYRDLHRRALKAQQATIRYLEPRIAAASGSRGVPVFWARSLSLYDTSFAAKLMTLLSESQNESVTELCLTTIALMGEKACAQIPSLETYLHNQSDSGLARTSQIVLAMIRHSLDGTQLGCDRTEYPRT